MLHKAKCIFYQKAGFRNIRQVEESEKENPHASKRHKT